jgi:pimeloyl-ACP methyl ester carboxylesterase
MKPRLYLAPGLLCDAHIWSAQVATLTSKFDIKIPDFTRASSIEGMASAILEDAPPRFSLAGHSMGARVALEVYRRAPEAVERLALLDTGTHPVRDGEAQTRGALVELAEREGMAALAAVWLPPMVHPDRRDDLSLMAPLRDMVQRMTPAIFRRQVEALLGRPNAQPVLGTIRCPLLIGVGRQDAWSPPAQHEAMVKEALHARYVVFEESGHMAPVERPDLVTSALSDWLLQSLGDPIAPSADRT